MIKLLDYQIEALEYLKNNRKSALLLECGAGKTLIMLNLIVYSKFNIILLILPKRAGINKVWENQAIKHNIKNLNFINLVEYSTHKKIKFCGDTIDPDYNNNIIICNYDSFWRDEFYNYLLNLNIDCIILDESHYIKDSTAKRSKKLYKLAENVNNKYIVTGTLLANSPLDVFGQYKFIDKEIFGNSYTNFRYFYANWRDVYILDKRFPYKNLKILHEKIYSCAFYKKINMQLPKSIFIEYKYKLPKKLENLYKKIKKDRYYNDPKIEVEASHILKLILLLQMVISGYIYNENTKIYEKIDNTKLNNLEELLKTLPETEQVVIFYKYNVELDDITDMLKNNKIKYSVLKYKNGLLDFQNKLTQILLIQNSSDVEGYSLIQCRYCIYYSLTYSLAKYEQSKKRFMRIGQNQNVFYYIFLADSNNYIDSIIYKSLQNNKNIIDEIINKKIKL